MKFFTVIALTLFAAAAAVENFGGKADFTPTGGRTPEKIELVYNTLTNKTPF